jgi:hypothetical protein
VLSLFTLLVKLNIFFIIISEGQIGLLLDISPQHLPDLSTKQKYLISDSESSKK